jgi:hypothetical protein
MNAPTNCCYLVLSARVLDLLAGVFNGVTGFLACSLQALAGILCGSIEVFPGAFRRPFLAASGDQCCAYKRNPNK